ncbi:glycoside hydrolase family 16 protein [Mariniluteicoccus flavus]
MKRTTKFLAVTASSLVVAAGRQPTVASASAPPQVVCDKGTPACQPLRIERNKQYRLKFHDEISDTALDTSVWNNGWSEGWHDDATGISGPVTKSERACYDKNNVSVSGGSLHLRLEQRQSTCNGGDNVPKNMEFTGSHVNTSRKFEFARGVFETRVHIEPRANGAPGCSNFSSAWTNGHKWPVQGEIDLYECLASTAQWHIHTENGQVGGAKLPLSGWHTMSYECRPTEITFRYDGEVVGVQPYTKDFMHYIILINSVGIWAGPNRAPSDFQVDYVRVWQTSKGK